MAEVHIHAKNEHPSRSCCACAQVRRNFARCSHPIRLPPEPWFQLYSKSVSPPTPVVVLGLCWPGAIGDIGPKGGNVGWGSDSWATLGLDRPLWCRNTATALSATLSSVGTAFMAIMMQQQIASPSCDQTRHHAYISGGLFTVQPLLARSSYVQHKSWPSRKFCAAQFRFSL